MAKVTPKPGLHLLPPSYSPVRKAQVLIAEEKGSTEVMQTQALKTENVPI